MSSAPPAPVNGAASSDLGIRGAVVAPALASDGLSADQARGLAPWRLHLSWVGFLVGSVVGLVVGVAVATLVPVGDAENTVMALGQLLGSVLGYAVMLAFEGRLARPYELLPRRAIHGAWLGLVVGSLLLLVSVGVLALIGARVFDGVNPHVPNLWPTVIQAGLVAGVSEEIIFRGVLYRLAERGLGTWLSMLLSGLVFGAAHLGNPEATWWGALAIAIEAGLMFAVLYAITRNLVLMMGIHTAWNLMQGPVLGSVISGSSSEGSGLLRSHPAGPELLSGGAFGIEASLVTVALLSVVTVAGAVWLHRNGRVVAPSWRRRVTVERTIPTTAG